VPDDLARLARAEGAGALCVLERHRAVALVVAGAAALGEDVVDVPVRLEVTRVEADRRSSGTDESV
jgi:hypothetical protein